MLVWLPDNSEAALNQRKKNKAEDQARRPRLMYGSVFLDGAGRKFKNPGGAILSLSELKKLDKSELLCVVEVLGGGSPTVFEGDRLEKGLTEAIKNYSDWLKLPQKKRDAIGLMQPQLLKSERGERVLLMYVD